MKLSFRLFSKLTVIIIIVALVSIELFLRLKIGLGDPPLYIIDAEVEYLMKPSSEYYYLGNTILTNDYSMRSNQFPISKSDPSQFRLLLLGDSIINGGSHTDQAELGSELLRQKLAREWNRPVVVGNISAESWGPPNLLAYTKKFGFFDADLVAVVLSSHDYADVPTFDTKSMHSPTDAPICALHEATQYIIEKIEKKYAGHTPKNPQSKKGNPNTYRNDGKRSLLALKELLLSIQSHKIQPLVVLFSDRKELEASPTWKYLKLKQLSLSLKVPILELRPIFQQAIHKGENPFRDYIHPNATGQELLARALFKRIITAFNPMQ